MVPRRQFVHDGKQCYAIAELSTCRAKTLDLLLSTCGPLLSVPLECREHDLRISGTSPAKNYFIDLTLSPMRSEHASATSGYVDTKVSAPADESVAASATVPAKKRKQSAAAAAPVEVYRGDDDDADTGPVQTSTDYYRRYDDHDVTVQVDIECMLHMTSVAKRADTLCIVIFSFSATGEPERILIESRDRNTTTFGTVTPQVQTCEVWALQSFKAVSMVVMQADDLSEHIKAVSGASQATLVTIAMDGNQAGPSGKQVLTFSAVGDIGAVARQITSDVEANVKFVNDRRELSADDVIQFSGRFGAKPLIQIGRISPICRLVRMYLSPNSPLKLHYTIPDLGDQYFFLSPSEEEAS